MRYWLLKSEPDVFGFADLKKRPHQTEPWNGIRNYQARNFMRDEMQVGDLGLFYHSNATPPGIAGIIRISRAAYPDDLQFDPQSDYYDPKSSPENPRWLMVDVTLEAEFSSFITLEQMRADPRLADLLILRRGNRLSITPVAARDFKYLCKLGGLKNR
ncbi:MAG: EVE domain-containing protein [Verrucomicrobiales bacterium]|nr:EVE domain-containing protein [Verrucomicrobiales bacterium]